MIYFSADFHLFHNNIIKYCKRPFSNVEEMHQQIIENFKKIQDNDTLIFVGDLTIKDNKNWIEPVKEFLNNIKGNKILVKGNHDNFSDDIFKYLGFPKIVNRLDFKDFVVVHEPIKSNKLVIHGHVHEKWKLKNNFLNVGVDMWDFKPVNVFEIKNLVKNEF